MEHDYRNPKRNYHTGGAARGMSGNDAGSQFENASYLICSKNRSTVAHVEIDYRRTMWKSCMDGRSVQRASHHDVTTMLKDIHTKP